MDCLVERWWQGELESDVDEMRRSGRLGTWRPEAFLYTNTIKGDYNTEKKYIYMFGIRLDIISSKKAEVYDLLLPLIGHCILVEEIRQKIVSAHCQIYAAHPVRTLKHINTQPSEEWSQDPLDNIILGSLSDPV